LPSQHPTGHEPRLDFAGPDDPKRSYHSGSFLSRYPDIDAPALAETIYSEPHRFGMKNAGPEVNLATSAHHFG